VIKTNASNSCLSVFINKQQLADTNTKSANGVVFVSNTEAWVHEPLTVTSKAGAVIKLSKLFVLEQTQQGEWWCYACASTNCRHALKVSLAEEPRNG